MSRFVALLMIVGILGLPFWWFEHAQPRYEVVGEVRDQDGPVQGAIVRFKGCPESVFTDESGHFRLPNPNGAVRFTVAKDGFLIAGRSVSSTRLRVNLSRPTTADCDRYQWVDPTPDPNKPTNCGNCHLAIHDEWQRSGHSQSANNRRFLDLYGDLLTEHPSGADVCSSCHAPTRQPGPFGEFDMRAVRDAHGLSSVHCDFCHKIEGPGTGEFGLTHGRYQLNLRRPEPESGQQFFFGPLDDVDRGSEVFSRFQRDSRLCAACHEGVVFGVPVYSTYSEWLVSPAGRSGNSCQGCHMAPTGAMTNMAPRHGGSHRDPATLANHRFFNGSQLKMLQSCLHLEATAVRSGADVKVAIALTARDVGHRVPTGFIDRQVILFVDASANGRAVKLLHGPTLPKHFGPEEGGRPGRVYARVLSDGNGNTPAAFWRADPQTLIDTRLRPGETDLLSFRFPPELDRVRLRLVHRRFWKATTTSKNWPADEKLIAEREIYLNPPPVTR